VNRLSRLNVNTARLPVSVGGWEHAARWLGNHELGKLRFLKSTHQFESIKITDAFDGFEQCSNCLPHSVDH
jgi:hypothetical protein